LLSGFFDILNEQVKLIVRDDKQRWRLFWVWNTSS